MGVFLPVLLCLVGPTHGSSESKAYSAVELEVIKAWLVKTTTLGNGHIYIYQEPVNRVLTHVWCWIISTIRLIFSVAISMFKTFRQETINKAWRWLFSPNMFFLSQQSWSLQTIDQRVCDNLTNSDSHCCKLQKPSDSPCCKPQKPSDSPNCNLKK